MAQLKTQLNKASAVAFINTLDDERKKKDSKVLLKLFAEVTDEKPKMWGASIIGYGSYHYKSDRSMQEGDWPLVGFSPRKQNLTLYVMPGFGSLASLLEKLGKHKTSKGCLYINKLEDVDIEVLKKLIKKSFSDMKKKYSYAKRQLFFFLIAQPQQVRYPMTHLKLLRQQPG